MLFRINAVFDFLIGQSCRTCNLVNAPNGLSGKRKELLVGGQRYLFRLAEAALLRLVTDPGDKSRAAPKLNGRTFEKLLGLFDRFAVGKELKRIVG